MRRLAMTLPALATVAVTLAGCGGSSSTPTTPIGGSSSSTPPAGSQSAPAGGGNAPANPTAAKAEITHNWETFLSSNTSHAVAASLLQNGDQLGPALKKATAEDKATGGKRSATVTSISFTSPTTALVNYTLVAAGRTLPASGTAVLDNGVWKVSEVTFCTLVVLGNGERPVKSCPS